MRMLSVKNLTAGYGAKIVLKDVNFSVEQGEMIGLIGPNGAGKSTLLKSLRNLIPNQQGEIFFGQRSIQNMSERDSALFAAYLGQQMEITFPYSAREIVLSGRYPHLSFWEREGPRDKKIVEAAMEYTGVLEFAEKSIQAISGGQRQRVLLAKVLAQQSPLLLLDEPATGLDIFYQEEIFRLCKNLCKAGKTTLMVVHELPLAARFCSRLILIGEGRILADGTPEEVLQEEVLSKAYHVPVRVSVNQETKHTEVYTIVQAAPREAELFSVLLDDVKQKEGV